jgi:hypothetical protein
MFLRYRFPEKNLTPFFKIVKVVSVLVLLLKDDIKKAKAQKIG